MARADRREDPRAKATFLSLREREPADPARIELELLSGLAIEHRLKKSSGKGPYVLRTDRDQESLFFEIKQSLLTFLSL